MVRETMILAFDTATYACTVAVGKNRRILAEETVHAPRKHMERLSPLIDKVLRDAKVAVSDIDVVAVGLGPGSFTGIRIGVSTAKGLAQALGAPLAGISTLDVLAYGLLSASDVRLSPAGLPVGRHGCQSRARQERQAGKKLICPVIDAKREQVYFAVYESEGENLKRLTDYSSLQPEDFCKHLESYNKQIVLAGDALDIYQDLFKRRLGSFCTFAADDFRFPKASNIILLAAERIREKRTTSYFELSPIYVRIPLAEEKRIGKRESLRKEKESQGR